jgi:cAMP-dependent protein kinase regulator
MSETNNERETQADLHKYLAEKNINELFVSILESILLNKPENPIGFMAKYLIEKYPEETQDIVKLNQDNKNPPSHVVKECSSKYRIPSSLEIESDCSSVDTRESVPTVRRRSSDCSSAFSRESIGCESTRRLTLPELPIRRQRRVSVCAEKITEDVVAESELKVINKTEAEAATIFTIMKNNVFLSHLDEHQTKTIQEAMFCVEKADGEVIINQGDEGDNFYCIEEGIVNVFIDSCDIAEGRKLVKTCASGDSFGELALMYNAPRAATCIASGNVRLWALDRVSFNVILRKTTIDKRKSMIDFLMKIPVFSQLTESELLTIADTLQDGAFKDGAVICKQGDRGDRFYVVHQGTAVCIKSQNNGTSIEVAKLTPGSYFGEIALLTSKPRQATVTAVGDLKCFSVDKGTFDRCLGPLANILMRSIPPSHV